MPIYKIALFLTLLLQSFTMDCLSQQRKDIVYLPYPTSKRITLIGELQSLRSTHATFFNGGSIHVCRLFSHRVLLGAGLELAACDYHEDNRAELRHLRFLPLIIDGKFLFRQAGIFTPFVQLSEGISFIRYNKKDENTGKKPYNVSEKGNYAYLGIGTVIKIADHFSQIAGVGLKGYHMSTNVLDVNPHGINFRLGYIFRPGVI